LGKALVPEPVPKLIDCALTRTVLEQPHHFKFTVSSGPFNHAAPSLLKDTRDFLISGTKIQKYSGSLKFPAAS
jgi:hypothetical protein